jgi:hypothetical protein|tara:strand:- start:1746 stop:2192 length:447 start_codon:yes stop_codon:yes gene_type:complete
MNKILLYVQFLASFIVAQSFSMWGQFYTLKYPNISMFKAFLMAIPFAWLDWFFMTIAVGLGHKHKLVTETQDTFLLIITQFTVILLINYFFLKQKLSKSDIVAFGVILVAFAISFLNLVSKAAGIPVPKKVKKEEDKIEPGVEDDINA